MSRRSSRWVWRCLLSAVLVSLGAMPASASAASLTVEPGVVVKFGPGAELLIQDGPASGNGPALKTGVDVLFTSVEDDEGVNETGSADQSEPAPAQFWRGITVQPSVLPAELKIDGLEVRYAGAGGGAALGLSAHAYAFNGITMRDNFVGLRADNADFQLTLSRINDNVIGIDVRDAAPIISESEIAGNRCETDCFGVRNMTPGEPVDARRNWWGAAGGPTAPPAVSGAGDRVSDGVLFDQALSQPPLLDCRAFISDGNLQRSTRELPVTLGCHNATHYRMSTTGTFSGDWLLLEATGPAADEIVFLLPEQAGMHRIRVQFGSSDGQQNPVVVVLPDVTFAPGTPTVEITSPSADPVEIDPAVPSPLLIAVTAHNAQSVTMTVSGEALTVVDESGSDEWTAEWNFAGKPDGNYVLRVVSHAYGQQTVKMRVIRLRRDVQGPVISDLHIGDILLESSPTITRDGALTFSVSDASGIASVQVLLGNSAVAGLSHAGASYSVPLSLNSIPDGSYTVVVRAVDAGGNSSEISRSFLLDLPSPAAPVILSPANSAIVATPELSVLGHAEAGTKVQIAVNGGDVGLPMPVSSTGQFGMTIPLLAEGVYAVSARASSVGRGESEIATVSGITYAIPLPQLSISSPEQGALVARQVEILATASHRAGIARVEIVVNDVSQVILDTPPYVYTHDVGEMEDGTELELDIEVIATSNPVTPGGLPKIASLQRTVFVAKAPPPPPPPPGPPYKGVIETVRIVGGPAATAGEPLDTWGDSHVQISGRVDTCVYMPEEMCNQAEPLPAAAVQLVLSVRGVERRFNLVSNAQGKFTYTFRPQASDYGLYTVGTRHPQVGGVESSDYSFTINRFTGTPPRVGISAARKVPSSFRVSLKSLAGTSMTNVTLQPVSSLPSKISIDGSQTLARLEAGATAHFDLVFRYSGDEPVVPPLPSGTIELVARSQESGDRDLARFRVDYLVSEPQPALVASPAPLRLGVANNGSPMSKVIALRNQGLATANNISLQVAYLPASGGEVWQGNDNFPDWFSASSGSFGNLVPGESRDMSVAAAPTLATEPGFYNFMVRLTAANHPARNAYVNVSVTNSVVGGAQFHVSDIYTRTKREDGSLILGVSNARVSLQNEVLFTDVRSANANADGIVNLYQLPAGWYTYRVSAPNRIDATGRILVEPCLPDAGDPQHPQDACVSLVEEVFVDFPAVTFEWSVTETTIVDRYDVVLTAVYQTQVPAPVVVVSPASINLPDLSCGEVFSGEIKIKNHGVVRADNVVFIPPASDDYYEIEFLAEVPAELEAGETVTVPYTVEVKDMLPDLGDPCQATKLQYAWAALSGSLGESKSGLMCQIYRSGPRLTYDYACANGARRPGSAASSFNKMYGACNNALTGGDPVYPVIQVRCSDPTGVGCGDWGGGPFVGGGITLNAGGSSALAACMPICDDCLKGGGAGGPPPPPPFGGPPGGGVPPPPMGGH